MIGRRKVFVLRLQSDDRRREDTVWHGRVVVKSGGLGSGVSQSFDYYSNCFI